MAHDLDRAGRSLLHYAAIDGDAERARELIATGEHVNVADRAAGFTPLHFAAHGRHAAVARVLLAAGAEVDPRDHLGRTPLATALRSVERGGDEIIALLLEHGACADVTDLHGISPRHLTQSVDHYALRRFLVR